MPLPATCTSRKRTRAHIVVIAALGCGSAPPAALPPVPPSEAPPPVAQADASRGEGAAPPDAAAPPSRDGGEPPEEDAGTPPAESFAERWQRGSIYLLMVDRFADGAPNPDPARDRCFGPREPRRYHGGDLVGLRQRLDYLEELGVDTVWVTPLTRQDGCGYHGYWTDMAVPDDGALEPRLGTEEDLRALLDAMHERGMRLILDMVVNHPGYNAPVTRTHPEWFHPVEGCERLGNPDETCRLSRLPDFNQSVPEAAAYIIDHGRSWLERFDVDGVRMDTVKHVPLDFFQEQWIPAMREIRPEMYLLGELFDGRPYDELLPYFDAGFDALFDFRLRGALVYDLGQGGRLNSVAENVQEAYRELGPERARLRSIFVENHDVPRMATELEDAGESRAIARHRQLSTLLTTTPGIPQIYSGQELGMLGAEGGNRRDIPDWAWSAETRTPHEGFLGDPGEHFSLLRNLLQLRRDIPALHAGDYTELWRPGGSDVPLYAFTRSAGESHVVVAISTGQVRQRVPLRANRRVNENLRALVENNVELEERLGVSEVDASIVDGALELSMPADAVAIWTL